MKETQRTGWLQDEDALEEYYYGPICESCGLRGEDCTCDAQEEEPPEEEPPEEEPETTEFRMRPSDACWSGDLSQQDWLDMNK